jgi:guanylate kinase
MWPGRCRRILASWALTDLSIFLSPLSREEIAFLKAPERNVSLQELLTDIMRRKLLRRTRRQKGDLSAKDLENVETRASSAYRELQGAWHFQYVIPNLIGDARKTFDAFVALLKGVVRPGVEKWEEDFLLPESRK